MRQRRPLLRERPGRRDAGRHGIPVRRRHGAARGVRRADRNRLGRRPRRCRGQGPAHPFEPDGRPDRRGNRRRGGRHRGEEELRRVEGADRTDRDGRRQLHAQGLLGRDDRGGRLGMPGLRHRKGLHDPQGRDHADARPGLHAGQHQGDGGLCRRPGRPAERRHGGRGDAGRQYAPLRQGRRESRLFPRRGGDQHAPARHRGHLRRHGQIRIAHQNHLRRARRTVAQDHLHHRECGQGQSRDRHRRGFVHPGRGDRGGRHGRPVGAGHRRDRSPDDRMAGPRPRGSTPRCSTAKATARPPLSST